VSELTNDQLDAIEAKTREYITEAYSWETISDYGVTADDVLALVAECRRLRAEVERANAKNERAVETLRAFGLLADDSEPDYGDASIGVIDE
jgi:hypothetical protein